MLNAFLAMAAGICLFAALIESWLLVAVLAAETGPVAKVIPGFKDLLRSHIDYLMMAQFLFVFYGLFRLMALTAPVWVVSVICLGSFCNPLAFLIRAIRPSYLKMPPVAFTGFITASCVATTLGYAAAGWMIMGAALKSAFG